MITGLYCWLAIRRIWRYQRGNQNPYIEEEQTIQWPKEKVQKDKQRSTKQTYKTKDRVTLTPLKTGSKLRCSGTVSSSCSTSGTRCVKLVSNPVISREWGKHREVFTTSGVQLQLYSNFVTVLFCCQLVIAFKFLWCRRKFEDTKEVSRSLNIMVDNAIAYKEVSRSLNLMVDNTMAYKEVSRSLLI